MLDKERGGGDCSNCGELFKLPQAEAEEEAVILSHLPGITGQRDGGDSKWEEELKRIRANHFSSQPDVLLQKGRKAK